MFAFITETPAERFDRLVHQGTIQVASEGFTWFCHMCKEHQPTPLVTTGLDHDWFDAVVGEMCEHSNDQSKHQDNAFL